MSAPIIDRQTRAGRHLVIHVEQRPDGRPVAIATVDGQIVARDTPLPLPPARRPAGHPDLTHILGPVALTSEDAARINAALAPLVRPPSLEEQRRSLVDALRMAEGHVGDLEEQLNETGYPLGHEDAHRRANEAREALQSFDAAHPEILAALRAARDERVARSIARGD